MWIWNKCWMTIRPVTGAQQAERLSTHNGWKRSTLRRLLTFSSIVLTVSVAKDSGLTVNAIEVSGFPRRGLGDLGIQVSCQVIHDVGNYEWGSWLSSGRF